jgi:uncharacterized membrane protein
VYPHLHGSYGQALALISDYVQLRIRQSWAQHTAGRKLAYAQQRSSTVWVIVCMCASVCLIHICMCVKNRSDVENINFEC